MALVPPDFISGDLNTVECTKRMKELEDESRRLKKMYAEEKLRLCLH